MKKTFILLMLIFLFLFTSCNKSAVEILSDENRNTKESATEETKKQLGVFVCGAVKNPGMYYLSNESRVKDAIEMAGGLLENASIETLNPADYLSDCQKIYVPTKDELSNDLAYDIVENVDDGKININTASKTELMTLPGIGEAKASSIIEYREEKGKFSSIEELLNVSGIKEAVFNKIKELIKI